MWRRQLAVFDATATTTRRQFYIIIQRDREKTSIYLFNNKADRTLNHYSLHVSYIHM